MELQWQRKELVEMVESSGNLNSGRTSIHALTWLIGGFGAGAALMYLFDPERGRGRRARIGDQVSSKANRVGQRLGAKSRDLRNRAQGVLHEIGVAPGKKDAETPTPQTEAEQ